MNNQVCSVTVSILLQFAATSVFAQANNTSLTCNSQNAPGSWFVYLVILFILLGFFASFLLLRKALADSKWKLGDALSEECKLKNAGADETVEMRGSTSRLVAFIGMLVILMLFIGFGVFILYRFAMCGTIDKESIGNISTFLVSGLTLFAPYGINVSANAFKDFSSTLSGGNGNGQQQDGSNKKIIS